MAEASGPSTAEQQPAATKRPRGRPTVYTEAVANEILERLANGETLKGICRDEHLPPDPTVRRWVSADVPPGFAARYRAARDLGYELMEDELVEIADDGTNDYVERETQRGTIVVADQEHIQRSKLRVDTRKFILAKCLPKKWGDKLEIAGKPGAPVFTFVIDRAGDGDSGDEPAS